MISMTSLVHFDRQHLKEMQFFRETALKTYYLGSVLRSMQVSYLVDLYFDSFKPQTLKSSLNSQIRRSSFKAGL